MRKDLLFVSSILSRPKQPKIAIFGCKAEATWKPPIEPKAHACFPAESPLESTEADGIVFGGFQGGIALFHPVALLATYFSLACFFADSLVEFPEADDTQKVVKPNQPVCYGPRSPLDDSNLRCINRCLETKCCHAMQEHN